MREFIGILKKVRCVVALVCLFMAINVSGKQFVVVIDAGHGGGDYGALGVATNEKTINLNVALKLGKLIDDKMDGVKVVYTRSTDRFISLQQRANIANKADGNLFISIHTNSVDKSARNRTTVSGAATYTLGMHKTEDNLAVAKRENSVIKLEKDYSTTYQGFDPNSTESYIIFEINQSKHVEQSVDFASRVQREFVRVADRKNNGVRQAGFWVLAKTSMPAVLVELDFICNPTVEKFLSSNDGQERLAKSIFNAFKSYYKSYYSGVDKNATEKSKRKKDKRNVSDDELCETSTQDDESQVGQTEEVVKPDKDAIEYRVQIFTSPKKLKSNSSQLRNLDDVNYYYENGVYKYTCGSVSDKKDALSLQKKMRKKFPQAFVVEFVNGKRVK
ncbi:MAG: N-acetylmuramoyl-L-alanine amidase [Bacteroidales bacterium]|nr:N-acetylmuramoyl-L-alanine amidase [Bacteroidales bacterium]